MTHSERGITAKTPWWVLSPKKKAVCSKRVANMQPSKDSFFFTVCPQPQEKAVISPDITEKVCY